LINAPRAIRGYAVSQRKRKRVEEIFAWVKTVGGLRKARHRLSGKIVRWVIVGHG